MTEEEKRKQILNTMAFIEAFDTLIAGNTQVTALSFDELDPETWAVCQKVTRGTAEFLQELKDQFVPMVNKMVDNDALTAHLQAVMLAPE